MISPSKLSNITSGPQFRLSSDFKPKEAQPEAIKQIVEGLEAREKYQTLLGVQAQARLIQ